MTQPFLPLPTIDPDLVTAEFRQRAAGAVLGSAVGDALGAPFEFGPAGQFSKRFPRPVVGGAGEMVGGGGHGWAPGEFTDDTQMAVVQAESLLANGGLDEVDLFDRFRMWASGASDVGSQTSEVLHSDLVASEAATAHYRRTGRSAGNGTVMRAIPTAVLLATASEAQTVAFARAAAATTHGDPATGWGTAVVHLMVRASLLGKDPWVALDTFLATLPDDQQRWQEMLAPDWTPSQSTLPNGSVWGCLAQAVWAVRTTVTFADAVTTAIDLGDDTDTVAAVTGGLAGAIHGITSIPSRWTTYLNGTIATADGEQSYDVDRLRELVQRLTGSTHTTYRMLDGAVVRKGQTAPSGDLAHPIGPTEIVTGLFAANLAAAATTDPEVAVVSLCLVGDTMAEHPYRREIHIVDQDADGSERPNMGLAAAVDDALASIAAFLTEGRQVVVHCFGGRSRTGLILRAHLMATNGWTDSEAIDHLRRCWPDLDLWNTSFTELLADHEPSASRT